MSRELIVASVGRDLFSLTIAITPSREKKIERKQLKLSFTQFIKMSANYTVADLKPRILENIDKLEYPAAYTFCQKALELEPHNAEILEITGQVELELEQFELARKVRPIETKKKDEKLIYNTAHVGIYQT